MTKRPFAKKPRRQKRHKKCKEVDFGLRRLNHLIGMSKAHRRQEQRAFGWSSWSDSGEEDDEKIRDGHYVGGDVRWVGVFEMNGYKGRSGGKGEGKSEKRLDFEGVEYFLDEGSVGRGVVLVVFLYNEWGWGKSGDAGGD
ncbi:hypothetical protein Tco_1003395 [Tanacetum coccineum]|uniref:Uncharacterized protein n=1 Tax=Tanacetum coccineum TaxID=301880 RepID=A0ABQ5FAV5_9ASTR